MYEHPDDNPNLSLFGWSDIKVLEDAYKPMEKPDWEIILLTGISLVGLAIVSVFWGNIIFT